LIPVEAFFTATDASPRNLCQFFSEPGLIDTADIPSSRSNVYFAFLKRMNEIKETAALVLVKYKLTIIRTSFTLMPSVTKEVHNMKFTAESTYLHSRKTGDSNCAYWQSVYFF